MKSPELSSESTNIIVAPFAGAWIEIHSWEKSTIVHLVAPFAGAWIEILRSGSYKNRRPSLPSRERGLKYTLHAPRTR